MKYRNSIRLGESRLCSQQRNHVVNLSYAVSMGSCCRVLMDPHDGPLLARPEVMLVLDTV